MILDYENVYGAFLPKVTDYKLLELLNDSQEELYVMMNDWLHSSTSIPQIRKLFQQLTLNDDDMQITFSLKNPVDEYSDIEYVCELLSQSMVVKWLEPQVQSVVNTLQVFGGKEEKFYSQSNHLNQLRELLKDSKKELKKLIRDYGYINISHKTGV